MQKRWKRSEAKFCPLKKPLLKNDEVTVMLQIEKQTIGVSWVLGENRSRFEKEIGLTPLTRNLPTREKDSGCSKDLALERQTSAGA